MKKYHNIQKRIFVKPQKSKAPLVGNGFEAEEAEPCVLVDPPNDEVNEEG